MNFELIARLRRAVAELMRRLRLSSGLPATGAPTLTGPSFDPIKTHPWVYFLALVLLAAAYYAAGLYSSKTIGFFGSQVPMFWVLGLVHFITGFGVVSRQEVGGILFLGIPTIEITGRPVLVPLGLFKLVKYDLAPIEIRVPRDPSKVWRGTKDEAWPEGFEEPLRVPFAGREYKDIQPLMGIDGRTILRTAEDIKKDIHDGHDALLMRGTQEVSFYVRLVIKQGTKRNEHGFFDFYVRIGDYEKARQQVKEMGIAKIFEDLTRVSMAEALVNLQPYNVLFEGHLRELVKPWGVEIPTAKIMLEFTKSLNEAILSIPIAKAGARATVLTAEGAKKATILAAEANKKSLELALEGKGAGQKKQMVALGVTDPNVIIAAEVADSVANGTNEKIVVLGADGLVNIASSIANSLKQKATV